MLHHDVLIKEKKGIWEESRVIYKQSKSSIEKKKKIERKDVYMSMKGMDLEIDCFVKVNSNTLTPHNQQESDSDVTSVVTPHNSEGKKYRRTNTHKD